MSTRTRAWKRPGPCWPGGVLVLSFQTQHPFIEDRIGTCLQEVFGTAPLCFCYPQGFGYGFGGVFFVTGDMDAIRRQLEANPRLLDLINFSQSQRPIVLKGETALATDDWPYLYLEKPRIPVLHILLAVILLGMFFVASRRLKLAMPTRGWSRTEWHFFFLGAAFLLLEVQNISKASAVLGNSWQVNAYIISSILAVILLANWLAAQFPRLNTALVDVGCAQAVCCSFGWTWLISRFCRIRRRSWPSAS